MDRFPLAPTQSVFDWFIANRDQVLTGSLVALGLVGLMLIARTIGQHMVAAESHAEQIGRASCRERVYHPV